MTMKCPDFANILDLMEKRLAGSSARKVEGHLQECSSCREKADWAASILPAIKHNRSLVDAPEFLIQRALGLFQQKEKSLKDWVLAKLEFDSWLAPSMAGVRSSDRSPRQRTFQTEAYTIIVMTETGPKTSRMTGQILAKGPDAETAGCLIELAGKKGVLEQSYTNRNGEFTLAVPPGKNLELRIHGEPQSVRIPDLI